MLKYLNLVLSLCFNVIIKLPKKKWKNFNGKSFILILHYLRNSTLPILNNINEERGFFSELNFWKICLIRKKIQFEFQLKRYCIIFTLDKSNILLKKNSINNGVVFIKQVLNSYNSYLAFISIKNVYRFYFGFNHIEKQFLKYLQNKYINELEIKLKILKNEYYRFN